MDDNDEDKINDDQDKQRAVDAVMEHFARLREQDDREARIYFHLPDWIKGGRLRLAEQLAIAEMEFERAIESRSRFHREASR